MCMLHEARGRSVRRRCRALRRLQERFHGRLQRRLHGRATKRFWSRLRHGLRADPLGQVHGQVWVGYVRVALEANTYRTGSGRSGSFGPNSPRNLPEPAQVLDRTCRTCLGEPARSNHIGIFTHSQQRLRHHGRALLPCHRVAPSTYYAPLPLIAVRVCFAAEANQRD